MESIFTIQAMLKWPDTDTLIVHYEDNESL